MDRTLRTMLMAILALPPWSPHVHGVDGQLIAEQCDQCHGPSGRSEDSQVPSIGGFSEYAIIDLLESFRIGFRQGRPVTLPDGTDTDMVEISRALSDEEIEAVAAHYARETWHPHKQSFDTALAKRGAEIHLGKCDKCHSAGGSVADDDLALLAGQWREYLKMEFEDFDRGARRMVDKMKAKFETLSDADKAALLEFYVSGGSP
ncbi:MAG: sulfide dehydrogenase [Gammaproteobacteria bacterium]|nr:sulfide dehydrogenase [Gammaproteobacteria bacterium]